LVLVAVWERAIVSFFWLGGQFPSPKIDAWNQQFVVRVTHRRSYMSSKVSTMDWDTANKANFKLADKEKGLAEQVRNDAWRAVKATDRQARVRQAANTKRLGLCH